MKKKRGLEQVTIGSLGYKASPEKILYLWYITWPSFMCNIKQFLSYSKNYIYYFMQANSWHHKLFHFKFPFWTWKVWKGSKKSSNIWISWEQKEPFRWNKKHLLSFLTSIAWWKKKLADTNLKPNNMGQVMDIEKLNKFHLLKEDVEEVR